MVRVLSVAYWLQRMHGEKPILLPTKQLAEFLTAEGLSCSHQAVSDITGIAHVRGLLDPLPYRRRQGHARPWQFKLNMEGVLFLPPLPVERPRCG